jgi:hypothetical protein
MSSAGGTRTAAVASDDGTINGAFRSGLFATDTCEIAAASQMCALVASSNGDIDGVDSAAVGTELASISHDYCVALGSVAPGTSPAHASVYGGHGSVNKWILYSLTGNVYFSGSEYTFQTLRQADPGAGSKKLWADPATADGAGNYTVKWHP